MTLSQFLTHPCEKRRFLISFSHFCISARRHRKPEVQLVAWPGRLIAENLLKKDNTLAKIECKSLLAIFAGPS